MPVDDTEKGFEQAIGDHLLQHGYRRGSAAGFDAALGLAPDPLATFLATTHETQEIGAFIRKCDIAICEVLDS